MARKQQNETNAVGQLLCPTCKAAMVPMKKGWRCSNAGKWNGQAWSGCNGVIWNNAKEYKHKEITRAATYPKLPKLTDEQIAISKHHSTSPNKRGSRLTIHNAGPGCAKTSSATAVILPAIESRTRLVNLHLAAFNRNAADNIMEQTPGRVSVSTLNGLFGRLQGYSFKQYDKRKCLTIFFDAIKGLGKEEKPSLGNMVAWADRMRDLLLYTDNDEPGFWSQAIGAAGSRFPGLTQKVSANQVEAINQYVPYIITRSMMNTQKIDLTEQYCRPALEAIKKTNWKMPFHLVEKNAEWTDDDIAHLAELIKNVNLPNCDLIVDEAQDLSLSQIVAVLACTYRQGELTIIGDDFQENPYKAGQAIFGWRGAFPGSMAFIARLWNNLTGEGAIELGLNLSQRCPPEVVKFVQPSNTVLKSAKALGTGKVFEVSQNQAFTYWINCNDNVKSLWITRKNAPLAAPFIATIKAHKKAQLRGNGEMTHSVNAALYSCAGWFNQTTEEFFVPLKTAMEALRKEMAEAAGEGNAIEEDSLESFILQIGEAILDDADILLKAELTDRKQSVGNLRRFLLYFIDHTANRVFSTVYRSKGDQADNVIVADVESLNSDWNGDSNEAAACRHVACTRSAGILLTIGRVIGMDYSDVQGMTEEDLPYEIVPMQSPKVSRATIEAPKAKMALNRPAVPYLPPAPVPDDEDLPNPDDDVDYLDDDIKPAKRAW